MGKTEYLKLQLTRADETDKTFLQWRTLMNGENVDSNMELIDAGMSALHDAVEAVDGKADGAVRFDEVQALTEAQKAQARDNIGASDIAGVVKYDSAQDLTSGQKSQGRTNIDAASAGDLSNVSTQLTTVSGAVTALQALVNNGLVSNVSETTGGIEITYADGTTKTIAISGGGGSELVKVAYDSNCLLHFLDEDDNELYGGPFLIEGGGGGASVVSLTDVVRPTTARNGADAIFSFVATSSDSTDITVRWSVNGTEITTATSDSGSKFQFNAKDYLRTSASNTVSAAIISEGGGSLNRTWPITTTAFSLAWGASIEPIMLRTDAEDVLAIIDVSAQSGTRNNVTVAVGENSRSQTVTGSATLRLSLSSEWFTTGVNTVTASMVSSTDESDKADDIHFIVMWAVDATDPIIAIADSEITGMQYDTIPISYYAYNPGSETADVTIQIGDSETRSVTVGRSIQTYNYVPQTDDDVTITMTCGSASASVDVTVTPSEYNIGMVTGDNLKYILDPTGHSNIDGDREQFAGLTFSSGFDWVNGGFQTDTSGCAAFVVKKGHRATLPRSLFADSDTNGKVVDISFKIVNSDQYDAVAMQDLDNGLARGVVLKANEGEVHYNNTTGKVFRYCEETRIDLSFHVEETVNQRVATVWLDGIPSAVDTYQSSMLVQNENNMVIGSDHCDVWVYMIRCYNSVLSEVDMLQNYISLGATTADKVARCVTNNVYTANSKVTTWYSHRIITPDSLHAAAPDLTIIEIEAPRMTVSKKDPVAAKVTITDGDTKLVLPAASANDAKDGCLFKVQGTSSVAYGRSALNMDIDFKGCGVKYQLSENAIPVNYLNIKVNVASSENANNVNCVDWYNSHQPFLIYARQQNSSIRDTVEGKPCAVFFKNTGDSAVWISSQLVEPGETTLYIMGDLCNSKKNDAVFGQDGKGEHYTKACIEVDGNDTQEQRFRSTAAVYNDEDGEWQTYSTDAEGETVATKHFEWRMEPSDEDKAEVVDSWNKTVAWCVSTIDNSEKFKKEFANYFQVDAMLYHFLMIEYFAAYDDMCKNTFYSFDWVEDEDQSIWGGYRWSINKAYDWDTVLAYDNDGIPLGDYGLDYGDMVNGRSYFNDNAECPIWVNIKAAYQSELVTMYTNRRGVGTWDKDSLIAKFDTYQSKRPHACMIRDAYIKYIYPYKTTGVVINGVTNGYDNNYLGRLAGSKTYQRRQFLTYQTDYMDGKYRYYNQSSSLQFRTNVPSSTQDFTIKSYAKTYVTVLVDGRLALSRKLSAGEAQPFAGISVGTNTTLYVTPDRLIQYIRPLNETQNTTFAGSGANKLMEAILGGETVNNVWDQNTAVQVPSPILKDLSIRNMTNFSSALNLTSNVELETLDTRGTNAGVITIAPYAPMTSIQLNACSGLTMSNITKATTFSMENGNKLTQVSVEGCNALIMDALKGYLTDAFENGGTATKSVRLTGVNWVLDDTTLLNHLLTARSIDANGNIGDAPCVLTGSVTVATARQREMDAYNAAWPGVVTCATQPIQEYALTFVNANGEAIIGQGGKAYVQYVESGQFAYDPITMGYAIEIRGAGTPDDNGYAASDYSGKYYLDTASGRIYTSDGSAWSVAAVADVLTPTQEPTAQYNYTFSEWANISGTINSNRTVTASYTSTVRTYTVSWYDGIGVGNGTLLYSETGVRYGAYKTYPYDNPTYTAMEGNNVFYVFNGWDASTGCITGDTVVKARWIVDSLPTVGEHAMQDMNWAQISAVAKNKLADTYWDLNTSTVIPHVNVTLGHDFDFNNVESKALIDTPTYFDGTTSPIIFNGGSDDRPLIQLFSADAPSFTMAIDYEFTSDAGVLVSCFEDDGNQGFELRRIGNYTNVLWGDKNVNVGYQYQREILTLRHVQGSDVLYVGVANQNPQNGANVPVANVYPYQATSEKTNAGELTTQRSTTTSTNAPLTLGGVGYMEGDDRQSLRGTGWIHWCKIWFADLGPKDTKELCVWPREEMIFDYTGIKYWDAENTKVNAGAGLMARGALPLLKQMNNQNTNVGGWDESQMRKWLNGQFFDALPTPLQSVIKEVKVRASAGNRSTAITASDDMVYLPALAEVIANQSDNTYLAERDDAGHVIPWFAGSSTAEAEATRVKFPGFTAPDDANVIFDASDPTMYNQMYNVVSGKTVWINTSRNRNAYIYVDADWVAKHKHGCARLVSHTDNIAAQGEDSSYNTGGYWLRAAYWWLRSPSLGAGNFWHVYANGGGNPSYAGNTYGVVPAFSI